MTGQNTPSPIFEGSEKRLELYFHDGPSSGPHGLRKLSRGSIDELLTQAACSVVSHRSNEHFDAYVLSESSLFVYPERIIIKTCGNTHLLNAAPHIVTLAASLGMKPQRCKYSRASYLFPELQPELYRDFAKETSCLEEHFGYLGESASYILGDDAHGLQWHIYIVSDESVQSRVEIPRPTYTLEVCMTELCPAKASQFARGPSFVSAKHTTVASGISSILPNATIDDFVFEPCGYSMNGLEGQAFSTIHITPECGFSYASLELYGYQAKDLCPTAIVEKAMEVFRPGRVTVSLSVDQDIKSCNWPSSLSTPPSYRLEGTNAQHFPCGGCHFHYSFTRREKVIHSSLSSPSTVLDNLFTQESTASEASDRSSMDGFSRSPTPAALPISHETIEGEEAYSCMPPQLAQVLRSAEIPVLHSGSAKSIEGYMASRIATDQIEDPLYCVDLGTVTRLHQKWVTALPRVQPFYAVKCFPDKKIISCLAALGAGFDCASDTEVKLVRDLGVPSDRIVLANCCKRPRDIRAANKSGVMLTTFDTVSELDKMAVLHPNAWLILRIRADDPDARCQLGNKYGAEPDSVNSLLQAAKERGLKVVGVSFHVGSAATNPKAFEEGISGAKTAFQIGQSLGFSMHLLDIGGGFSSNCFSLDGLRSIPASVNQALEVHFPVEDNVKIIAEPGRYFTEEAATLACMVIGNRHIVTPDGIASNDYYIPDGLYGSMNSLLYDHAVLSAHPLGSESLGNSSEKMISSTVFGPTCDGLDVVLSNYPLPQLANGDWLVFPKMGAYTLCGASDFNGMGVSDANVCYVFSQNP